MEKELVERLESENRLVNIEPRQLRWAIHGQQEFAVVWDHQQTAINSGVTYFEEHPVPYAMIGESDVRLRLELLCRAAVDFETMGRFGKEILQLFVADPILEQLREREETIGLTPAILRAKRARQNMIAIKKFIEDGMYENPTPNFEPLEHS